MLYRDINFDGLVGPTHNYAGLSIGNVASVSHKGQLSNPRSAALQGLQKAKFLADRGFPQAILPPPLRPSVTALRNWGFGGKTDNDVISAAASQSPSLLAAASSASAMWTANACIMTPSCDSSDGKTHFTPANLSSKLHRSIEVEFTTRVLENIFANKQKFTVHEQLKGGEAMADEGAANHTRLSSSASRDTGLHIFVYGRSALDQSCPQPRLYPARQTRESLEAIARRHGIPHNQTVFLQQSPDAIDAGVFHNDVISVGNDRVLFLHELSFKDTESAIDKIQSSFFSLTQEQPIIIKVTHEQVSLMDAVSSYLFNSQLLTKNDGTQMLVVPSDCYETSSVSTLLKSFLADSTNPISEVLTFDLRQSMRNGGGPACLRNRITLNESETNSLNGRVMLDDGLYTDLESWVQKHYRETLAPEDLADPHLLLESQAALAELSEILQLPGLYD